MTTLEVTITNRILPAAIALALAAIPNLALAADDTSSTAAAILGLMDSTKVNELLGMVFGSAAGGTGKTLIGEMFRHFNSAILAVASILLTYNLFTGVAESTYHGEFLGKRHSTVWVPVRLPVAAAMMFPTTNGLSAIQLLMIKLALLGSATGDWMWSKTTAAIYEDGVPVVVQPAPRPQGLAEGLFVNHLCKHVVNINEVLMTRGSTGPITTAMVAPEGGAIQLLQKSTNPRYYRSCGSATVEVPAKTAGGTDISALRGVHQAALQAMSDRMNKVALDFAYVTYPGDLTEMFGAKPVALPDVVSEINAANDAYTSAVEKGLSTVRQQVRAAEAGGKAKANSMASQGWTMAGAYYLDLIKANMAGSEIAGITPKVAAATWANVTVQGVGRQGVQAMIASASDAIAAGKIKVDKGSAQAIKAASLHSRDDVDEKSRDEGYLATKAREAVNDVFLIDMQAMTDAASTSKQPPVAVMIDFGQQLINKAIAFFAGGVIVSTLAGIFTSGFGAVIAPLLFSVFGILLGVGMTLAWVLPTMPYLSYTMGVIGFMILVVESVIAAQLWAFGHLKMEGEGFTGGVGNTGYMIVLNIILRPSLMLLGLVLSIGMTEVSVKIVNESYFVAMANVLGFSGKEAGFFAKIFFAVVYGGLNYYMCTKSFQLITQVPDRVLRWIGGGDNLGEHEGVQRIGGIAAAAIGGASGGVMGQVANGLQGGAYKLTQTMRDQNSLERKAWDKAAPAISGVFSRGHAGDGAAQPGDGDAERATPQQGQQVGQFGPSRAVDPRTLDPDEP